MKCPKCKRVQYYVCGQEDCVCCERIPKGKKPQIHLGDDYLACPYCSFAAHMDYWEEKAMDEGARKAGYVPRKKLMSRGWMPKR